MISSRWVREKKRHESDRADWNGRKTLQKNHAKALTPPLSKPTLNIEYYRAYRTGTGLEAVGVVEGVRRDRGIGIEGEVADGTRYMSCCVLAPTFDCWLVRACAAGKRRELEAETIAMVIYPTNNYWFMIKKGWFWSKKSFFHLDMSKKRISSNLHFLQSFAQNASVTRRIARRSNRSQDATHLLVYRR